MLVTILVGVAFLVGTFIALMHILHKSYIVLTWKDVAILVFTYLFLMSLICFLGHR